MLLLVNAFFPTLLILSVYAVGGVIDWLGRRNGSIVLNVQEGRARYPGTLFAWGVVSLLMAPAVVAFAVLHAELRPYWWIALLLASLFVALGAHCISKWMKTRWSWDADGITYISGKNSTRLRWADITTAKWTHGGWRITGPSGSVSSSATAIGYVCMSDALIEHRLDLAHITYRRA